MAFAPTIARNLNAAGAVIGYRERVEHWIESKIEEPISHGTPSSDHIHGGVKRFNALSALLETGGDFSPFYAVSDDLLTISKVHSRKAVSGVLNGIAQVSYDGYNAFVLYLNALAKAHKDTWDTNLSDGARQSAQANYQRLSGWTGQTDFNTLMDSFLARVRADTSTSKDRLAEQLVETAERHRKWLLGGTGSPRSSQEESACDSIEGHVRSGIISIQREPMLANAIDAFNRAQLSVESVHMDGVAPRFRVAGAANDLRAGSIIPTVADATPPFLAGHIEAYLPHVDEPVWIESVVLDETKLEWRRAANVRGAQRIGLYWKVAGASSSENVILKARGAIAARSLTIVVPAPRAST